MVRLHADFPWGRGLINFAPEEEGRALETYATWARLFELLPHYSWIVDRFHLSTQLYQQTARHKRYDFAWLEDRLRPLGFRLVFCTSRGGSFAAAREARLQVSGNPSQYDDLDVFIRDQDLLRQLVAASTLPTLQVDVSDDDVAGAVERIADWMASTGGLWPREDRAAREGGAGARRLAGRPARREGPDGTHAHVRICR